MRKFTLALLAIVLTAVLSAALTTASSASVNFRMERTRQIVLYLRDCYATSATFSKVA